MKSFNSSHPAIIIFLLLFIVICFFLIIRLEIKAANLQSRWDEHKKSLEQNNDVLEDLFWFYRSTKKDEAYLQLMNDAASISGGKNFISVGSAGIQGQSGSDIKFGGRKPFIDYFGYDSNSRSTFMRGVGNGNVFVRSNNGENYLRITDDEVAINAWDKNKHSLGFSVMPSSGRIDITSGGNRADITLEEKDISMNCENEINFEGKILNMVNASGICKIIMAEEDIHIICTPSNGPVFGVLFGSATQSISINTQDASIILAKDVIHFEAESDINITSKNGNVNIKGKKVKVNE